MKIFLSMSVLLLAVAAHAQVHIQPNTVLKATDGVQLVFNNTNINNQSAQTDFSNAILVLKGNTTNTLNGNGSWKIKHLKIDKGSGKVLLETAMQVSEKVQFVSGKLDLNNQILTLGQNAYLQDETADRCIIGPNGGTVQITKTLAAPSAVNAGNLGAVITSSANLGTLTIKRMHKIPGDNGDKKAKRYYEIIPANNSGLNAKLRLHYLDNEHDGIKEAQLIIIQRTTNGGAWTQLGYSNRSAGTNYVEKTGLNTLKQYALKEAPADTQPTAIAAAERSAIMETHFSAVLAPVPAYSNTVLTIATPVSGRAQIQVVTADGKIALQQNNNILAGINTISLDVSRLSNGTYFVRLLLPGNTAKTLSLIKQ